MIHDIKVVLAKHYVDNLSEEASKGMLAKAEAGYWPSFAPIGYRNVATTGEKRTIEPDPDRAPIIILLFERYVTRRYSIGEITVIAQEAGLTFRKTRNKVNRSTVHKILRSRLYCGEFDWRDKTYQGRHQPLVSRDLWQRVQVILDERNVAKTRGLPHPPLKFDGS